MLFYRFLGNKLKNIKKKSNFNKNLEEKYENKIQIKELN